jgi:hypothetical protein
MSAVFKEFAADIGAGPKKRIVVVLDGAGWHKAKDFEVPEGIHLVFLPPYSPELRPAERLWPLINEVIANRTFTSLSDLIKSVGQRCVYLEAKVRPGTGPHHLPLVAGREACEWGRVLISWYQASPRRA